jgi:RHS repeat-associated protein
LVLRGWFLYGKKWRKTVINANGTTNNYRDYIGDAEYKDGQQDIIHFSEGYVQRDATTDSDPKLRGWVYKYNLKDHLGNTRVTYSDRNCDGIVGTSDIEQVNHYYAFGLNMEGPWNGADGAFKYQYNGKELNRDFGLEWNDYGARMYDATVGRFSMVDPLSVLNVFYTPYHYASCNPINRIDPDGRYDLPVFEVKAKRPPPLVSDFSGKGFSDAASKFWDKSGKFAKGVTNAILSNIVLGAPGTRNDPNEEYEDEEDMETYAMGQRTGDALSFFIGGVEMTEGAIIAAAGVVLEVPSLGTSTLLVGGGSAISIHGGGFALTGARNFLNPTVLKAKKNKNRSSGDDEVGGTERMGRTNGNTPRNNQAQNKQVDSLVKKYNLSKDQRRKLHDIISGRGYGYKEIEEIIKGMIKK